MKYEDCFKTCTTPGACETGCAYLNGGTIDTKDHRPDTGGKYSPEQIAYLDQCAIAAMQMFPVNMYGENEIVKGCYDFAEAMLQERTKRLEK